MEELKLKNVIKETLEEIEKEKQFDELKTIKEKLLQEIKGIKLLLNISSYAFVGYILAKIINGTYKDLFNNTLFPINLFVPIVMIFSVITFGINLITLKKKKSKLDEFLNKDYKELTKEKIIKIIKYVKA